MADGFRIQSVLIEGFKGFTKPQSIDLKGRHIFLLGRNGNGKSSIVEAIRWGLFGSLNRPNEIVKNSDYKGRCRVTLTLHSQGKQWNLRRTLIRGVSGGSDPVFTDENGNERSIREVIPSLDSINAGEGTHIIFSSPQSAQLRHQSGDLMQFQRTVLNHIGLLHPQVLQASLVEFIDEQHELEGGLDKKLEDSVESLNRDIEYYRQLRGRLLSSPPWGDGLQPTIGQSESKVRSLIQEISGNPPDKSLDGASLDALLENANDALDKRRERTQSDLEAEVKAITLRVQRLEELRNNLNAVLTQQDAIECTQSELVSVLGSKAVGDIRNAVEATRAALDIAVWKRRIVDEALSLLDLEKSEDLSCPVCAVNHRRNDLHKTLLHTGEELASSDTSDRLKRLEAQLDQVIRLEDQLGVQEEILAQSNRDYDISLQSIGEEDKRDLSEITLDALDRLINQLRTLEGSLREQIAGNQGALDEIARRIPTLDGEKKFHNIQKELHNLTSSKSRFDRVYRAFRDLVSYGESVEKLRQAVEVCFDECLKTKMPSVSEDLSQVFAALTHHPYFDRLTILNTAPQKLEIRVTSSQDPERTHPTDVLNGQAESALALVPYFTFSQSDDDATEVYLVMLDDPTQAFDEEHIEILIALLAKLGNKFQLLVASQESTHFRNFLPKHFEQGSYAILEPTNWSYQDGPELNIEHK